MEASVAVTYRCNAKCRMCNTWQHPTKVEEEITPEMMDKIPGGMARLNITGGEPMLREDIEDIVAVLSRKTNRLEISTNGVFSDKIINIARKFPDITIRVSLEGFPRTNDNIRGIKDGFHRGLRTMVRLMDLDIKDIGFGMVIQDENYEELIDLYKFISALDVEFAQCISHNSFYFHKLDNDLRNREKVINEIEKFVHALLTSKRSNLKLRVKDWFRAYINRGLIKFSRGEQRSLPCSAGSDLIFVDPFGNVFPCNVMEKSMGNLRDSDFNDIWKSTEAEKVRNSVRGCRENCWMTGTSVPAMRKAIWNPVSWVIYNKLRIMIGKDVVL